MKKTLIGIILLMFLFTGTVCAMETTVNDERKAVVITSDMLIDVQTKMLVFCYTGLTAPDVTQMDSETVSDSMLFFGKADFIPTNSGCQGEILLKETNYGGYCTVVLTDGIQRDTDTFYLIGNAEKLQALAAFNAIDTYEELEAFAQTYGIGGDRPFLKFSLTTSLTENQKNDYMQLLSDYRTTVFSNLCHTSAEVLECLENTNLMLDYQLLITEAEKNDFIEANGDILHLEIDNTYFKTNKENVLDRMHKLLAGQSAPMLYSALSEAFYDAIAIESVNRASRGELSQVLEDFQEGIGITLDSFYRKNAVEINKGLETPVFKSLAEIKTVYENSVAAVKAGSSTNPSNRSTSSGSSKRGSTTVEVSAATEAAIEAQKNERAKPVFTDIGETPWAEEAIYALAERGVLLGVGNGLFAPNEWINREQFVKIVMLALNIPCVEAENIFLDVDETQWYANYVLSAAQTGIINGVDSSNFGVGQYLTRQDMCTILYRTLQNVGKAPQAVKVTPFSDETEISDYAREAVYALKEAGVIQGVSENCFSPGTIATRAQAAKILYEIIQQEGGRES